MNNKALVEISVPAAGQKYDVYIPLESKMSEVVAMVAGALSDLSNGSYKATNEAILCDADTGIIFNPFAITYFSQHIQIIFRFRSDSLCFQHSVL